MKSIPVIAAILLLGSANAFGQSTDTDTLLGAVAGAALGSTIGQGDGKTIATVIGGLLGAQMVKDSAAQEEYGYASGVRENFRLSRQIRRECERNVPLDYKGYSDAAKAWVKGCIERKHTLLLEVQDQAYQDGLNDRR